MRARGAVAIAGLLMGASIGCSASEVPDGRGPGAPTSDTRSGAAEPTTSPAEALAPLRPLRVTDSGGRPRIADDAGAEVLLRGASLTALTDYHQADPRFVPTKPPTDADWDQMAGRGFSVVRLVVSWSALEPTRGQIDLTYVEQIRDAIAAAAERRIHTVLAMHQDGWSRFLATPPFTACPTGTEPDIGGNGAPVWAALTDGLTAPDTCRPVGVGGTSPAVQAAFGAFYENLNGIRDAFVAIWRVLAEIVAADPAVAGFDLLDEPLLVHDPLRGRLLYSDLVRTVVDGIRAGERDGGGFEHIVFLQPLAGAPTAAALPVDGVPAGDHVALAPHLGIVAGGPERSDADVLPEADLARAAADRGWALWVGQVGPSGVDDQSLARLRDLAIDQDDALVGAAHWRWRQWCGDPASLGRLGQAPGPIQIQLNDTSCPDDVDAGPNVELLAVAGRAYPRAAPGRLTALRSDATTGALRLAGAVDDDLSGGGDLVVWVPGDERPELTGQGIGDTRLVRAGRGWYAITEITDSPYELEVE